MVHRTRRRHRSPPVIAPGGTYREKADIVVASIYVNPTQFAAHEDFDVYPRNAVSACTITNLTTARGPAGGSVGNGYGLLLRHMTRPAVRQTALASPWRDALHQRGWAVSVLPATDRPVCVVNPAASGPPAPDPDPRLKTGPSSRLPAATPCLNQSRYTSRVSRGSTAPCRVYRTVAGPPSAPNPSRTCGPHPTVPTTRHLYPPSIIPTPIQPLALYPFHTPAASDSSPFTHCPHPLHNLP